MSQRPLFLLALLLIASPAFAQGSQTSEAGYIDCPTGQQNVYLYRSLTNFEVLASPKCDDRVQILGRETILGGYLRVRTADDKEGYVPQGHVKATPPVRQRNPLQEPPPPLPAPAGSASPLSGGLSSRFGYDVPLVEVFGGYSYLNVDTNGSSPRRAAQGWAGSMAFNFTKLFAAEGSASGHYKSHVDFSGIVPGANDVSTISYSFLGGPRINFRPAFVHALVGIDRVGGSQGTSSASQNSLAMAFGGGAQWDITQKWAVGGSADYVVTRHSIFAAVGVPSAAISQHNIRLSVGVVFKLGRLITE